MVSINEHLTNTNYDEKDYTIKWMLCKIKRLYMLLEAGVKNTKKHSEFNNKNGNIK